MQAQALAINLAQQGCHLALADINQQGLAETVERLGSYGVKTTQQMIDVSDKDAVYKWAERCVAEHSKVNFIFNNAGVALSGTVSSTSTDDYQWIMNINFWGVLYGTKAFLPYLEKSGQGHVINLSSISGLTAQPLMSGYNASKFAVRGFTESLRQDLLITGSQTVSSCVHPGGIKTNIAKSSRMDSSVAEVTGSNREESIEEFEKLFFLTPDKAAKIILKGVSKKRARILIGTDARFFDYIVRLLPSAYQRLFAGIVKWQSAAVKKKRKQG